MNFPLHCLHGFNFDVCFLFVLPNPHVTWHDTTQSSLFFWFNLCKINELTRMLLSWCHPLPIIIWPPMCSRPPTITTSLWSLVCLRPLYCSQSMPSIFFSILHNSLHITWHILYPNLVIGGHLSGYLHVLGIVMFLSWVWGKY